MHMLSQALKQAQVELGIKIIALWQCKVYTVQQISSQVLECCYRKNYLHVIEIDLSLRVYKTK